MHLGYSEAINNRVLAYVRLTGGLMGPQVHPWSPLQTCVNKWDDVLNSWQNPPFGSLLHGVFTLHNREGGVEPPGTARTTAKVGNQSHMTWGERQSGATLRAVKDVGVAAPTISPFVQP